MRIQKNVAGPRLLSFAAVVIVGDRGTDSGGTAEMNRQRAPSALSDHGRLSRTEADDWQRGFS